jgi:hypothetical protein
MSDELLASLRPLVSHVAVLLQDKPALRQELVTLARAIANWVESAQPVPVAPVVVEAPLVAAPLVPPPPPPADTVMDRLVVTPPPAKPIPSFAVTVTPPPGEHGREFIPLPLQTVAARCRVKSAATGLVAKRVAGMSPAEFAVEEEKLRKQAEVIPDCGLWMLDPNGYARSQAVWVDLAGCFAVCAAAADLLRSWSSAGADLSRGQEVLTLAAEAQSMLLYAVADVGWVSRDHEQVQMFVHVRELGKQHQIYVPRFLRREDPAEPANWQDLLHRLKAATEKFGVVVPNGQPGMNGDLSKVRQKALGNLKFKLKKLADDPSGVTDEWPRLVELLDQAVSAGVAANSPEFREVLLPIYDHLPDHLPITAPAERVLRAIESHREPAPPLANEEPISSPSGPVADYMRGKEVVVLGGAKRPHESVALKLTLGLADVRWLTLPDAPPYTANGAVISRPEVVAVVLATRWSNHDFDDVRQTCVQHGKPFVRLKASDSWNSVVNQIAAHVGEQLDKSTSDGFSAGL